jgi:protease I
VEAGTTRLQGKRIVILVDEGFEASELTSPRDALAAAGATVVLAGAVAGDVYRDKKGLTAVTADLSAVDARRSIFDAVVIPGGHAPDKMRMRHAMVDLVAEAMQRGTPVAAICHGPQVLISANALRGRTLTCWPSIAIDVKNAGGLYVDRPVVRDGNLITSRKPDDLAAFNEALIQTIVGAPSKGA